jgi:hypothetical protein
MQGGARFACGAWYLYASIRAPSDGCSCGVVVYYGCDCPATHMLKDSILMGIYLPAVPS